MESLKANAGKISLIAVLLLAAIGLYIFLRGRSVESRIGRSLTYVCAETGKTFEFSRGKTRAPPLENPKTGRRTLVACYERDGQLYISTRHRALVRDLAGLNKFIDPETLQVRESP